ncbi:hypothetical protein CBR_g40416 [Chara braunii]|uniref:Uncharacterized protein n=1 Tax=Chara braunii TaxID=69332 RepID=A0A388LTN4_CHABU|nr:hypothetical protein CBR_g40416 [Chara braunii]|eukprot:GBG85684.1 hypothetical protein CBR_g40416 [Chara braunii]
MKGNLHPCCSHTYARQLEELTPIMLGIAFEGRCNPWWSAVSQRGKPISRRGKGELHNSPFLQYVAVDERFPRGAAVASSQEDEDCLIYQLVDSLID